MASVEHRDPLAGPLVAETDLVALPRYPRDHVADAAPGVEAAVQELQLRLARLEAEEVEGGAEQSATSILITTGVASPPLQSPR